MTAELRHTERQRTIKDVYEITDIDRAESKEFGDIKPATVAVTLDFDFDEDRWALTWLSINGPMYKSDGKLGIRWINQLYTDRGWQEAPDFAQKLVRQSFREAEGSPDDVMPLPTGPGFRPSVSSMCFRMSVCKTCSTRSPWYRDPDTDVYRWNQEHYTESGHGSFWTFEVQRNMATMRVL